MWTIIFFTSWHCSSFVMGNDDWLSHLSWYLRSIWHFGSGWCTPLQIRIALNMNPIEQNHFKRGHQVHFTIYPPPFPVPLSDSMPEQETGEFQFQMDMDIWTWTPSATPHQPTKEWNAHFWITFNFWWSAGLLDGLEPHPPSLSSQKNEMLIFRLCSTSDDGLGWSMDSNPIHHPSPARKMKCSFLDYTQLLVIDRAIQAIKVNWNVTKGPLSHRKMKYSFL